MPIVAAIEKKDVELNKFITHDTHTKCCTGYLECYTAGMSSGKKKAENTITLLALRTHFEFH